LSNPGALEAINRAVENMIRDNADVKAAFHAMRLRGLSRQEAKGEIGRAFLGCWLEDLRKMPDRWEEVLRALAKGKSTMELFPDGLYDMGEGKGSV
jgi:hypothetical protein